MSAFSGTFRQSRLTLGLDYERLAQILFKTVLTFNIFSVKVPKKQAARYMAFDDLLHFRAVRDNLS